MLDLQRLPLTKFVHEGFGDLGSTLDQGAYSQGFNLTWWGPLMVVEGLLIAAINTASYLLWLSVYTLTPFISLVPLTAALAIDIPLIFLQLVFDSVFDVLRWFTADETPVTAQQEEKKEEVDEKALLKAFICPLTKQTMVDPVVAADGYSYEREAIKDHLNTNKRVYFWFFSGVTSPVTGEQFANEALIPNLLLKDLELVPH